MQVNSILNNYRQNYKTHNFQENCPVPTNTTYNNTKNKYNTLYSQKDAISFRAALPQKCPINYFNKFEQNNLYRTLSNFKKMIQRDLNKIGLEQVLDPKTNKHKYNVYRDLYGRVDYIEEFNDSQELTKKLFYRKDIGTLDHEIEFNEKTGVKIKKNYYQTNGSTYDVIYKYSPTGKLAFKEKFTPFGNLIDSITKYNIKTGKKQEKVFYREDNNRRACVIKYDKQERINKIIFQKKYGRCTKATFYYHYDPKTLDCNITAKYKDQNNKEKILKF